jgi:4-methyl-5(b-hydroxyethyl)-thiazole monophosphate biosynthesis
MSKRVLVPLAQSCEELEAVTIIDLLVRAGFEVVTASLDDQKLITCSRGVQLVAQTTLEQVLDQTFDLVVLPGGLPGADYLNQDERVIRLLQQTYENGNYVAAICAAPKVLVSAGLLDGREATSYPGVIDQLPAKNMTYLNQSVVKSGRIMTSKGPGTAMDFALELIRVLSDDERAQQVEKSLVRAS